jgi:hypothetical protein
MGAHQFTALGGWGGRFTTIAARRCDRCGFMYVAMNHTADPAGSIILIGEDGGDLNGSEVAGACPMETHPMEG